MVTPLPTPRRPDHDKRSRIRVALAASVLRRDHDSLDVAQDTGVPLLVVRFRNAVARPPSGPRPGREAPLL